MMRLTALRRVPVRMIFRRVIPAPEFSTITDLPPDFASEKPVYKEELKESEKGGFEGYGQNGKVGKRVGDYQEEQSRVFTAALEHVSKLGWSDAALMAGAKDVGLSPSIVGSFPRKEASLVEFFMDDCLEKLLDKIESGELNLNSLILSDRLSKLLRLRLEIQSPYISKWAQALSIQGQPQNMPASFKQRAALIDEIWHTAGDQTAEIDWYIKRAVLGGIYSAAEIFMLTDNSPEFHDTWQFLDRRIKDAFDIQNAIQEAAYLAEAVGAGVGNSVQALLRRVSQGI